MKNKYHGNSNLNKTGVAILLSGKVGFRAKTKTSKQTEPETKKDVTWW